MVLWVLVVPVLDVSAATATLVLDGGPAVVVGVIGGGIEGGEFAFSDKCWLDSHKDWLLWKEGPGGGCLLPLLDFPFPFLVLLLLLSGDCDADDDPDGFMVVPGWVGKRGRMLVGVEVKGKDCPL